MAPNECTHYTPDSRGVCEGFRGDRDCESCIHWRELDRDYDDYPYDEGDEE